MADQLKTLGASILDGDRAGHEVLRQPEVKQAIYDRWGEAVFARDAATAARASEASQVSLPPSGALDGTLKDCEVNRAALARLVFAPTEQGRDALEALEQITHPRIKLLLEEQMAALAARNAPLVVLDAPVMIKAGWHKFCNVLMFVEAPASVRLERARRRGWEDAEFFRREAAQESLEYKKSLADVLIDNSGSPLETRNQVEQWWRFQFIERKK